MSEYQEQPKGSGFAITGMILGIISLVPCVGGVTALLGLIFSIVGLSKASKGTGGGKGMAIAGLVTSIFGGIISALIIAGMLLPALSSARDAARMVQCSGNIKQIGLALQMYAQNNNNKFPSASGVEGLNAIYPQYIDDPKVFVCPAGDETPAAPGQPLTEANCSYIYVGGIDLNKCPNPSSTVVLIDKDGNHLRGGCIGYADGHVSMSKSPNWKSKGSYNPR